MRIRLSPVPQFKISRPGIKPNIRKNYSLGPLHWDRSQNRNWEDHETPYRHSSLRLGYKFGYFFAWVNNEGNWGSYWKFPLGWFLTVTTRACYGHNKLSRKHCDIRGHYIPQLTQERHERTIREISIYEINL